MKERLQNSIGISTSEFVEMIPAGRELPTSYATTFSNAEDNQTSIRITLAQKSIFEVTNIAEITVGIPPAPKATLNILIAISVDEHKVLKLKVDIDNTNVCKEYGPFYVS